MINAARRGEHEFSRALSVEGWSWRKLSYSKAAECAFATWAKVESLKDAVSFETDHADGGWDVNVRGKLFDVKSCEHYKEFLIWPLSKFDDYERAKFDYLVLVRYTPRSACLPMQFETFGWITKKDFWEKKFIAPDGPPAYLSDPWKLKSVLKLKPGTPYVVPDQLTMPP